MASLASPGVGVPGAGGDDDDDFLRPSKGSGKSDFVMGMAQPPAATTTVGGATAGGGGDDDVPMEEETSKQIMFKLLVSVGSDPKIPTDVLVTKNFVPLSDAIASDVEDGMGGHISETFVTCIKELPSKSGVYAALFATINIEDPDFCGVILKLAFDELNQALAEQRYATACNLLRFLAVLPKVRAVSGDETVTRVLGPLLRSYQAHHGALPLACREQVLACLLACALWGGQEVMGGERAAGLWTELKAAVAACVEACGPLAEEATAVWSSSAAPAHALEDWVAAVDAGLACGWAQKVAALDAWKPLFVLVCAELDNAMAADEAEGDDDDEGPMEPIEPVSIAGIEGIAAIGLRAGGERLGTFQAAVRRHGMFRGADLGGPRNKARGEAMEALTGADRCVVRQTVFSVLRAYFPLGGEAAQRLVAAVPADAEHVVLETVFQSMLELPEPAEPWVYYGNVISALCLAKKSYPLALADTVNNLFDGIGGKLARGGESIGALVDDAADRLSQWMAWHLNRFKWKWPFHWWEQYEEGGVATRGQTAFLAAVTDRCLRLSFGEQVQHSFPPFLHRFLGENTGVPSNPFKREPMEVGGKAGEGAAGAEDRAVYVDIYRAVVADLKAGKESGTMNVDKVLRGEGPAEPAGDEAAESSGSIGMSSSSPAERTRALVLALFQTGHRTLTHLRARAERFKGPLLSLVGLGGEEDGPGAVVRAVVEFWSVAPTMMINTMNILVEFRVITGADVVKHVLSRDGGFDWYARYWPWEMVGDALSRTLKKECIAAPRPFAGVHQKVRDAETEERFASEAAVRKAAVRALAVALGELLAQDGVEEGKKCVLRSRAKCLKQKFALAIEEFREVLPEGNVLSDE